MIPLRGHGQALKDEKLGGAARRAGGLLGRWSHRSEDVGLGKQTQGEELSFVASLVERTGMALRSYENLLTVVLCNQDGVRWGFAYFLYLLSLLCQSESHSSSL